MRSLMRPLSAVSALLLLAACAPHEEPADSDASADASSLAEHRARWDAAGMRDYTFEFQQQCFCVREQVQPVTIDVRGGRVVRVVSRETGEDITAVENLHWPTIDELFGIIADRTREGGAPVTVRYDEQLGYPAQIEIGTLADDSGVIYEVSGVRSL